MIDFNQKIIELLPTNVYLKDCNGVYLACSNEFATILQLSAPSQIIGKTDYDLLPPEHAKKIAENDSVVIKQMGEPEIHI